MKQKYFLLKNVKEYELNKTSVNEFKKYSYKEGKDGKPYYGNAIVWKNQHGVTWSGACWDSNGERIGCSHYIKSFPFEPKTFVVDVIEKEINPDDWEFYLKDQKQLDEVFEYYNKKKLKPRK